MKSSVTKIWRPVRRRLRRLVQRGRDRDHARWAQAILALWETKGNVSEAARRCLASRNSVRLWKARFKTDGEAGLEPLVRGRAQRKATAEVLAKQNQLVRTDPTMLNYLRSRWRSERLALELARCGMVDVHAKTVRRWLSRLCVVWRRA